MTRGPDAATWLERALIEAALENGVVITVTSADWTRWASATFVGARHELRVLAVGSSALDAWLTGLSEHEFRLPGHIVADIHVTGVQREGSEASVRIEALTVEAH